MRVSVVCNLCQKDSYHLLFKKEGFNIVKCNHCGLVYVNPRPSDEDIKRIYQRADYFKIGAGGIGYRDYLADEKLHTRTFEREFNIIAKHKNSGNLLDVGCAAGLGLEVAKKKGWKVKGVEISEVACNYAKGKFGLDIFRGSLEEAQYPDCYFDLIMAYGTIEHIQDPMSFLREVKRVLKDGGIFILATPDIGSWLGKRRFQYKPLEHLYYFNRNTITAMLKTAGLEAFGFRRMKVCRSLRFLLERLRYYFKGLTSFSNAIELIGRKAKFLDLPFFIPDGQMVVYAKKLKK